MESTVRICAAVAGNLSRCGISDSPKKKDESLERDLTDKKLKPIAKTAISDLEEDCPIRIVPHRSPALEGKVEITDSDYIAPKLKAPRHSVLRDGLPKMGEIIEIKISRESLL